MRSTCILRPIRLKNQNTFEIKSSRSDGLNNSKIFKYLIILIDNDWQDYTLEILQKHNKDNNTDIGNLRDQNEEERER